MHIVVIYGWQDLSDELAGRLAKLLNLVPFETKQRLLRGGPTVIANFAQPEAAGNLAEKLVEIGLQSLVIDTDRPSRMNHRYTVKSFRFGKNILRIETCEGPKADIPYEQINLLLAGTGIVPTMTQTTTVRKISLKKTVLAGGIPLHKEVTRHETLQDEQRQEILYLQAGKRSAFVFRQHKTGFDGLGSSMQLTSDRNLALLKQRLRQNCPNLRYDERLLTRSGQVRLLGPALNPEQYFDLALEILQQAL